MTLDDLLQAWPSLVLIAAGLLVLSAHGQDPEHTHTVDDDRRPQPRHEPRRDCPPADHTPTPDLTPVPWTPPYAMLTVAASLRRFGDSPTDIADRWLREIAAEQRKAVTL